MDSSVNMWKQVLVASFLFLIKDGSSAASQRPHIVFILVDDVGWNDVSIHGSNQIPTPNIDALFYYGVALHQHYVESLCSPTRAALLTGRYPSNIGMQTYALPGAETRGLPPGKLLSHHLKSLGYATRIVGKWHLGFYQKELTPTYRGFDSHLGFWNGLVSYYDHIYEELYSGEQLNGLDFRRNMEVASDLTGRYTTDVFTEEAVNIIENHNRSTPLFLYLAHGACHLGNVGQLVEAPREVMDKFGHIADPNRKTYAAMMWKLDESVGKVTAALAKNDMLDNTIIVFLSDNGAPALPTAQLYPNFGSNYPLRGLKGTPMEGGIRGVAALWCPWLKSPSRVSTQLMHVSDWLPTLYVAAGGKLEDLQSVQLDGVDQWSALINDTPSRRTEMPLYINDWSRIHSVRRDNWKLVRGLFVPKWLTGLYGDSGLESGNPAYNVSGVLHSAAGEALATVSQLSSAANLTELRKQVTVSCPQLPNAVPCSASFSTPCLFDLSSDPCESNNLAQVFKNQTSELNELLNFYLKTMVPMTPFKDDPEKANPANFGNVWVPWGDSFSDNSTSFPTHPPQSISFPPNFPFPSSSSPPPSSFSSFASNSSLSSYPFSSNTSKSSSPLSSTSSSSSSSHFPTTSQILFLFIFLCWTSFFVYSEVLMFSAHLETVP